ncbi:hypothetical protein NCS52_01004200 [Fusarium sp. LHS14.1]|nr:hypothetical protein NCS52_01004200 [Fusarium sp. LHS14.1]
MKRPIKGIKRYITGYKTISKHISSVNNGAVKFGNLAAFSVQERDDVQFVALVDGDAYKFKPGRSAVFPKWVTKDDELPRFEALLRTYKEMCHEDLDPTGLVRMRQSPLYVGCSKDLRKRMMTYGQNSLPQVNRHLALTIKVLAQLSLSVDVHVRPVLLIWKKDQLPVAEQLVATIAGSLIYQYGFKAIEAGGTGSKTVDSKVSLASNARLIMNFLNDMRMNVRETLEKLQSRKQFLGRLSEAQQEAADINETMQACLRQVRDFPNHPKWNSIIDEMNEIAKRMQGRLDNRKEALRQWQLLREIERMLVSPVGTSHT